MAVGYLSKLKWKNNRQKVNEKRRQLDDVQEKLYSVEEKWIKNEISRDTYDRWYSTYNHTILSLKGSIERLGENTAKAFEILEKNLTLLSDMRYVYTRSDTLQKREFINMVFDNNLYYQDSIYRTPTMLRLFTHNALQMKEEGYLIYEKKEGLLKEVPLSGESGIRTRDTLSSIHTFQACSFNHSDTSPISGGKNNGFLLAENIFCI